MSKPTLVSTRTWLDVRGKTPAGRYRFSSSESLRAASVYMDRELFQDLGEPESITVTIKPGNDFALDN